LHNVKRPMIREKKKSQKKDHQSGDSLEEKEREELRAIIGNAV